MIQIKLAPLKIKSNIITSSFREKDGYFWRAIFQTSTLNTGANFTLARKNDTRRIFPITRDAPIFFFPPRNDCRDAEAHRAIFFTLILDPRVRLSYLVRGSRKV